jgi:hypothetical protein
MQTIPFPDLAPDHPANKLNPALLERNSSTFAPKLTFADRCSAAALQLAGINPNLVAIAYGVNRRTITSLVAAGRKAYGDVKRELASMGREAFIAKYVTEDAMKRVNEAGSSPEAALPRAELPPAGVSAGIPNRRATGHAGINMHRGPTHEYTHRVEIKWCKPADDVEEGWYSDMLDVPDLAGNPFGDPDNKSHLTSQSALRFAKSWLDENV